MPKSELETLRERASKEATRDKNKRIELYQYAKEQGFTPIEARLLCGTSRWRIERLAKLKEKEES